MSKLKGNRLTPLLVAGLIVVLAIIYFSGSESSDGVVKATDSAKTTDGRERIETPTEEVQRLSGQVVALEDKIQTSKVDTEDLANQVTQKVLASLDKNKEGKLDSIGTEKDIEAVIETVVSKQLTALLNEKSFNAGDAPDVNNERFSDTQTAQVNNTEERFANAFGSTNSVNGPVTSSGNMQWKYPVGYQKTEEGLIDRAANAVAGFGEASGSSFREAKDDVETELKAQPVMTLPPDSRVYDVLTETALVGRIAKNGTNKAPWTFSATLSNQVSLPNGHRLPEIAEARVSGLAIGDLAGECVKGYITSMTFIFPDGRIANSTGSLDEPIAKIADEYGNPCIPGYLVDNWNEVVAAQGAISGLASVAESIQKRQQTVNSSATQQSLSLTGSATKAATGAFASGGLNKTAEMMADRYESFYSFIYIEPGETITLLVEKPVNIDYDPTSRKVRYEESVQFSYN